MSEDPRRQQLTIVYQDASKLNPRSSNPRNHSKIEQNRRFAGLDRSPIKPFQLQSGWSGRSNQPRSTVRPTCRLY
jgi:hypothetical protein